MERTTGEMTETGEMKETVNTAVEGAREAVIAKGYRETKKPLKTSSTSNSCSFKLRMEVTLRYLNKLSKKNWTINSKNSWPSKKKRAPKLRLKLRPLRLRRKKRKSLLKRLLRKSEYGLFNSFIIIKRPIIA